MAVHWAEDQAAGAFQALAAAETALVELKEVMLSNSHITALDSIKMCSVTKGFGESCHMQLQSCSRIQQARGTAAGLESIQVFLNVDNGHGGP